MEIVTLKQQILLNNKIRWLLLDAAVCPDMLWMARGQSIPLFTLFNDQDSALVEQGPWLIHIEAHPDIIALALEQDTYGYGSLWFNSSLPIKQLHQQLQERLYVTLPTDEESRFRWYDPRVFHPYISDTSQERRDEFLSPFDVVIYASLNPFEFEKKLLSWAQDGTEEQVYILTQISI